MIITISGKPGSGKSTIAKELSKILGYKRYYIGGMRREIARKLGITLAELNKRDEEEFFSDRIVDERIVEIAKNEDNVIIEGRTAFYFVPYSVKVFLDVDLREGARRIYQHSKEKARPEESYPSVEETYNAVCERMESDKRRYSKYYGFDCYDTSHYDIVID
ncbi:cytidylate kinase family protein, partial [Candidatus Woesearchaeota archaeon]|nr:cytidylate kinase family protein [Candidatus Woesearchaeota archaeon]